MGWYTFNIIVDTAMIMLYFHSKCSKWNTFFFGLWIAFLAWDIHKGVVG